MVACNVIKLIRSRFSDDGFALHPKEVCNGQMPEVTSGQNGMILQLPFPSNNK